MKSKILIGIVALIFLISVVNVFAVDCRDDFNIYDINGNLITANACDDRGGHPTYYFENDNVKFTIFYNDLTNILTIAPENNPTPQNSVVISNFVNFDKLDNARLSTVLDGSPNKDSFIQASTTTPPPAPQTNTANQPAANQAPAPKNGVTIDDKNPYYYTFTSNADGTVIKLPAFLFGSTDPASIDSSFDDKGNLILDVKFNAALNSQFDRGTWKVTQDKETGTVNLERTSGGLSTTVELIQSGGQYVLNKGDKKQAVYDVRGKEIYSCDNRFIPTCDILAPCTEGDRTDCLPPATSNDFLILTGCRNNKCDGEDGGFNFGDWITPDICLGPGGMTYSYDAETGSCAGISSWGPDIKSEDKKKTEGESNKDIRLTADVTVTVTLTKDDCEKLGLSEDLNCEGSIRPLTVTTDLNEAGETIEISCGFVSQQTCDAWLDENLQENARNLAKAEVHKKFVNTMSASVNKLIGRTSAVGDFIDLGKTYGWWDDSFLIYDKWMEDNDWLRAISDMDRYICELETDYDDLLDEGFLPTPAGKGGADIQAEKFIVTEINTTTLNETTFKRYKVTFNVNGYYIFKPVDVDFEGNAVQKYETEIQVFLDSESITKKIKVDTQDNPQTGTSSIGRPIIVKSDKNFKKACIKFFDTGDLDPYVQDYLSSNSNKVCNDVQPAYVPALAVPAIASTDAAPEGSGAGGSGGGSGGGPATSGGIPTEEVVI